ncbi:hypothetical protein J3459_011948 [Metarhizium acridum]|uniref:uncharacterized protein n=1 Tax=Metarhizium acridum TaxID=92637 RepID=UPI001C6C5179|nr:hypothetical protein J3458_022181 [Metarhizium acridum]KAG8418892.1 hypothetical protein J3459_011948 [Metarhizium acridum]
MVGMFPNRWELAGAGFEADDEIVLRRHPREEESDPEFGRDALQELVLLYHSYHAIQPLIPLTSSSHLKLGSAKANVTLLSGDLVIRLSSRTTSVIWSCCFLLTSSRLFLPTHQPTRGV